MRYDVVPPGTDGAPAFVASDAAGNPVAGIVNVPVQSLAPSRCSVYVPVTASRLNSGSGGSTTTSSPHACSAASSPTPFDPVASAHNTIGPGPTPSSSVPWTSNCTDAPAGTAWNVTPNDPAPPIDSTVPIDSCRPPPPPSAYVALVAPWPGGRSHR